MNKELSFQALYENRQAILEYPGKYMSVVTRFSAGGFGACAYQAEITAAELVSCWQHEEYQVKCPYCGETAYIIRWTGKVNDGCFWEIKSFCPHCGKEHHAHMCGYQNAKGEDIHYKQMMVIAKGARNEIENNRYVNYISVFDAFKRNGWVYYNKFQAGNCWMKGEDEVTCFLGKYKFNGRDVNKEFIHSILHIDRRFIQMCEKIGKNPMHSQYGRTFFEGVKWADTHPSGNLEDGDLKNVDFSIIHEAFDKQGWLHSHGYAHGVARFSRWAKGGDEICGFHGKYTLNGKPIEKESLCRMLHIDRRVLQVSEAILPHPIHGKYGKAFLDGVKWADEHPIEERKL